MSDKDKDLSKENVHGVKNTWRFDSWSKQDEAPKEKPVPKEKPAPKPVVKAKPVAKPAPSEPLLQKACEIYRQQHMPTTVETARRILTSGGYEKMLEEYLEKAKNVLEKFEE